jgi:hypothetical protein
MFAPNIEEVTGRQRTMHNEKLNKPQSVPYGPIISINTGYTQKNGAV